MTAGFENARDFSNRFPAPVVARDVVNRKLRDRGVKGGVGERELAHVTVMNFDAIGNRLDFRVSQRGRAGIVSLIDL